MKTIYHPTTGSPREVPESAVDAWAAQGWLKSKPKSLLLDYADIEAEVAKRPAKKATRKRAAKKTP